MPRSDHSGGIALGIDPGTRRIGYGIVRAGSTNPVFVTAGILGLRTAAGSKSGLSTDDAAVLNEIREGIAALIKKYRPSVVGIERLFFSKNQKTAMAVAQARGAVLIAAREAGVPVKEYTPNEMKLAITGYGFADKKAVLKMVRLTLGRPDLDVIDDASDALALAIMACGA